MRNMDSMSVCTAKNIYVLGFRDPIWLKSKHDDNNNYNKNYSDTDQDFSQYSMYRHHSARREQEYFSKCSVISAISFVFVL